MQGSTQPAGRSLTVSFTRNADLPMRERARSTLAGGSLASSMMPCPPAGRSSRSRHRPIGVARQRRSRWLGALAAPFAGSLPGRLAGTWAPWRTCAAWRFLRSRNDSSRVGKYGSGSGSRNSRFTLSSRPARSAATASGSCRAALAMMPIMKSVVAVDVPPAEISGSCRPVTGSSPIT